MQTVERLRQERSTYEHQREKFTRKDGKFEITSADVPDIQRLRSTGSTWKQIADAKYPGIHWQRVRLRCLEQLKLCSEELGMNATEANVQQTGNINLAQSPRLQAAYSTWQSVMDELYLGLSYQQVRYASSVRQTRDHGKPGRPVGSGLRLSSADLAEIQRLRESRHTWQHITNAMYPSQSIQQVQYAFKRQFDGHRERRPVFEISSADLAEIHHLRQSQKTWQQIADAKYPGTAYWLVRDAFTRQFDGQTTGRPKFIIPSSDIAEICHLHQSQKTWQQIVDAKYPGTAHWLVRDAFVRQFDGQSKSGRPKFTIPSADFAKIRSLREVKMSWTAIATLMYPNIKYQTLSNAFAQQTGEGGESKITRHKLVMTSADVAKIRSLREVEAPWTAIGALMYPNLSVTTVRAAFVRQTGDRDVADGWRPRFNIPPTDMADVRRLRSEGRTWEQIKDMKYPGRNFQVIRKAFLHQDDEHAELKRQSPSRMTSVEVADIQRLRDEGMTWPHIRDVKYPGRHHEYVAKAFLQHGGVRSERKCRQPQTTVMSPAGMADSQRLRKKGKTREPIHAPKNSVKSSQRLRHVFLQQSKPQSARNLRSSRVSISPAVLADIQRLRAADTPWREITALYLPDKSLEAARMLILRRMEGLHGTDNKHMWLRSTGAPRALEITPADFQEIRRLLEAKMVWEQITLLRYPGENRWNVRKAFLREEAKRGEERRSRLRCVEMNPSDIRDIQSLRQAKTTGEEIKRLRYPDKNRLSVRRAFLREEAKHATKRRSELPALEMNLSDIEEIQRLRRAKTPWEKITRLKYADEDPLSVRQAYLRDKERHRTRAGRPRALELAPTDAQKIERLLERRTSWQNIMVLLYPDQHHWNVRKAFLRWEKDEANKGRGRQSDLEFRPKDIREIKRLRKAKRTWQDVTALMYPGRNPYNVRRAFHRQTADKVSNEEEFDVNTEEEE
jgi:hypothetical protein